MMRTSLLATCVLLITALPAMADKPVLTVLTYDSFVTDWGPGPAIKAAFEVECACELRLIAGGDGASLLARLRLEGPRSRIDAVLGLDTNLMAAATETGLFAPHGVEAELDLPIDWVDEIFLPFDWGWFAFVHDRNRLPVPPRSFAELAASDLKVVIQDPRSSTPGLGLLMWVAAAYGDAAPGVWHDLADNILTVTPGWSESYDLFLKGEADMVLSYTTSPAYHIVAEGDDSKAAALFDEGHYLQVEVAGMLADAPQPDLARQFMDFVLSDAFQAALPETNWMYPARMPAAGITAGITDLPRPGRSLLTPPDAAPAVRDAALEVWRAALAR